MVEYLFEVINFWEDVLCCFICKCVYFKYVEGWFGEWIFYVDEIFWDGFCVNMIDIFLCFLKVVINFEEVVWDVDIVVVGFFFIEIWWVFKDIGWYWREWCIKFIIIFLVKGVEIVLDFYFYIIIFI